MKSPAKGLFGSAAIVLAVIFPLGDVHIHTIAGLAQRDSEFMLLSCLEGRKVGCLGQVVVPSVYVDGDEVAFANGLRHDDGLVVVAVFLQGVMSASSPLAVTTPVARLAVDCVFSRLIFTLMLAEASVASVKPLPGTRLITI